MNDEEFFALLNEVSDDLFDVPNSDDSSSPNMDDFRNTIILDDEDGGKVRFEFLDLVKYKGKEYVILLPLDENEDSEEVVILKIDESDSPDKEAYVSVDDEETLYTVFNIFKEKFKDEFNFLE